MKGPLTRLFSINELRENEGHLPIQSLEAEIKYFYICIDEKKEDKSKFVSVNDLRAMNGLNPLENNNADLKCIRLCENNTYSRNNAISINELRVYAGLEHLHNIDANIKFLIPYKSIFRNDTKVVEVKKSDGFLQGISFALSVFGVILSVIVLVMKII